MDNNLHSEAPELNASSITVLYHASSGFSSMTCEPMTWSAMAASLLFSQYARDLQAGHRGEEVMVHIFENL